MQLHADWTRHLVATDPDRRDLVLSCGAALHHLLVALAARGLEAAVDRLPDPDDTGHLATVTLRPGAGLPADPALLAGDRPPPHRPAPDEPPAGAPRTPPAPGRARAPRGCTPHPGHRRRRCGSGSTAALADAAARQDWTPGYPTELELWTRRYAGARDGVPAGNIAPPPVGAVSAAPLRQFPRGGSTSHGRCPARKPASTPPNCW